MPQPSRPASKPQWSSRPTTPFRPASSWSKPLRMVSAQDRRAPMVFVNENIKAPNIIIIDEEGINMWTFPRRKALEIAEEQGKDLVQIRYDQETMTSTVKLLDYGKYMYLKWKEDKEKKKNQKVNTLKELKINYAIWENDLQLKIKKAREMLQDGYNVKFFIKLRGREKIYAAKAIEKLAFVKLTLVDVGRPQFEHPKQEVQWYSMILFNK